MLQIPNVLHHPQTDLELMVKMHSMFQVFLESSGRFYRVHHFKIPFPFCETVPCNPAYLCVHCFVNVFKFVEGGILALTCRLAVNSRVKPTLLCSK